MSQQLLERCLESSAARGGGNVTGVYKPWANVDLMQTLLIDVHEALGCSWIMAIVMAAVGIRVITLPISIAATRGSREKALLTPKFKELTDKQKEYAATGNHAKVGEVGKELQDFTQRHGKFFVLKGTWNLLLFQMPLYITVFASMRGFAANPDLFRGFAMEAPLWLDSLALPDPYAVMPMLTAAVMLTNTELFGSIDTEVAQAAPVEAKSGDANVGGQSTFVKYQKWIMRGSSLMFIPLTWNFPAGVFVYMSTNLFFATLQNRLLRWPVLERLLELPPPVDRVAPPTAERPSPLLALRGSFWHVGNKGSPVAVAPSARSPESVLAGAAVLSAPLYRPLPAAVPGRPPTAPRSLPEVNPRYAVRRARPAEPSALPLTS